MADLFAPTIADQIAAVRTMIVNMEATAPAYPKGIVAQHLSAWRAALATLERSQTLLAAALAVLPYGEDAEPWHNLADAIMAMMPADA